MVVVTDKADMGWCEGRAGFLRMQLASTSVLRREMGSHGHTPVTVRIGTYRHVHDVHVCT